MLGRPKVGAAGSDGGVEDYANSFDFPRFPKRANSDSALEGTYEFHIPQRANSDSEVQASFQPYPNPNPSSRTKSFTRPDYMRDGPYRASTYDHLNRSRHKAPNWFEHPGERPRGPPR